MQRASLTKVGGYDVTRPGPGRDGPEPEDTRLPLLRYVRIVRERWKVIAAVTVVVMSAVGVGVAATAPVYRATGTIEIRKQASEVVPVDALFQFERISDQYLQTEYGTLRSRALLRRTFADASLAGQLQHHVVLPPDPDRTDAATTALLAEELHENLIIDPLAGSRIVRVHFESPDPVLSATVVNALIEQYVAMREDAAGAALIGLAAQRDSVRTQLLNAEQELQAFVHANGLNEMVVGGTDGETMPEERLRRLQQELTETEAEAYRSASQERGAGERGAELDSELLQALRERRAVLAGEYARSRPTFNDSFPRMRQLRSELAQLDSLITLEQERVTTAMSTQHAATLRRRDLLRGAVDEQRRMLDTFATSLAEYDRRHRDVEALKQLFTVLQQKQKEAALAAGLARMDIAVLDAAAPGDDPVRPQPKRDMALALVVGLLLGIALAFLLEAANNTVRTPQEVGGIAGVPLLAMIPSMPRTRVRNGASRLGKASAGWHRIDAPGSHHSPLAEAFRGLRTSVLFDAGASLPRTILITSSSPDEGKTTVSTNFALSLALLGHRVLLVDADMRKPSLHGVFDVVRGPGLFECLQYGHPWLSAVRRDVSRGLDLMPAGDPAVNPSDVLSGSAIGTWLAEVSAAYDFVIIDAPALFINVPDARILAHAVEGVVLVVRSGSTSREVIGRLAAHTPNLIGIVLNQLALNQLPAYYAAYGDQDAVHAHAGGDASERNGRHSVFQGSQ